MRLDFDMVRLASHDKFEVEVGGIQWIQGNEAGVRVCHFDDTITFYPWHMVRWAEEVRYDV